MVKANKCCFFTIRDKNNCSLDFVDRTDEQQDADTNNQIDQEKTVNNVYSQSVE